MSYIHYQLQKIIYFDLVVHFDITLIWGDSLVFSGLSGRDKTHVP